MYKYFRESTKIYRESIGKIFSINSTRVDCYLPQMKKASKMSPRLEVVRLQPPFAPLVVSLSAIVAIVLTR